MSWNRVTYLYGATVSSLYVRSYKKKQADQLSCNDSWSFQIAFSSAKKVSVRDAAR